MTTLSGNQRQSNQAAAAARDHSRRLTRLETRLLHAELGSDLRFRVCLRTGTRVDAGRWLRRAPLWLCVSDRDVVSFAVARRRYFRKIPIADCAESYYCAAAGALVLSPAGDLEFTRFLLTPRQALSVLREIEPESPAIQS